MTTTTEFKEYVLSRTSGSDVKFVGQLIVSHKSPGHRRTIGKKPTKKAHWYEVDVYRTRTGKLVVHAKYRFQGDLARENPFDSVTTWDRWEQAIEWLDDFDAVSCVNGFPPAEYWAEKQRALQESLEKDWEMLVESVETELARMDEPEVIE